MDENISKIEELEQFLLNNDELEKLEAIVSEFNVFEVLDIVPNELKHSKVLSWILDPSSNHGLDDKFLREFLKHIFLNNKKTIKSELAFFDIDLFNFDDIEVYRERFNIDILLVSPKNNLVIVIENKISTEEHSNQLERYRNTIEKEYNKFHKLFIYLTIEGDIPSDDNWIRADYKLISFLLEKILEQRRNVLNLDIYKFLSQYLTILRRKILQDSDIETICKNIYKKYSKALDLIYQYKTDIYLLISEKIQEIIKSKNNLILDVSGKMYIRFTSNLLDNIVPANGEGWTGTKRILLFEFTNYNKALILRLYIGPGDPELRLKLHDIAKSDLKLFNKADRKLGVKWLAIYQRSFLSDKHYEENTIEDTFSTFHEKFDNFLNNDLKKIEEIFEQKIAADNSNIIE